MFDFIFLLPDAMIFAILSCILVITSLIGIFIVKYTVPLSLRYKDNNVIGYTSALISVIYGVLAGLTAVYLFNNNDHTSDAVQREANATADIYRDSDGLGMPMQNEMRNQIKQYLHIVIDQEWPAMQQGKDVSNEGN